MKIHGSSSPTSFSQPMELPRPNGNSLRLTIKPLPLSFYRKLRIRGIVPPVPPQRVARDSSGKPVKDGEGLALIMQDHSDAHYLDQLELYQQRIAVVMVYEALKDDPEIEFETEIPHETQDWIEFADGLTAELESAGWSAGDLILVCKMICQYSNLLTDHLQEFEGNFFRSG